MRIRDERPADITAIHAVVAAACRPQEAALVDRLRERGELIISLVAEDAGQIVGHVAFSRLKSPPRALALAPASVSLPRQRNGIGSALIRRGLASAAALGFDMVFVLGWAGYYPRFGFSSDTAAPFPCRYAGPNFMALTLRDAVIEPSPVIYSEAFDSVD